MNRRAEAVPAARLAKGDLVVAPRQGTGLLVAHAVSALETVEGELLQVTTEDGRAHIVGGADRVLVLRRPGSGPGR